MEYTGLTRKMDSIGRFVIPRKLREQMRLTPNREYGFFTMEDDLGRRFICIECPGVDKKEVDEARRIIEKYGEKFNEEKA